MKSSPIMWWGYKHMSGTYHAKIYFNTRDILEAKQSPFCQKVVGPFSANNRHEALIKVKELTSI